MKRRSFVLLLSMLTVSAAIFGASPILAQSETEEAVEESAAELEDGIYTAEFDTDSGMFRVNEANDGKGILTVKDGEMTIHVSLG